MQPVRLHNGPAPGLNKKAGKKARSYRSGGTPRKIKPLRAQNPVSSSMKKGLMLGGVIVGSSYLSERVLSWSDRILDTFSTNERGRAWASVALVLAGGWAAIWATRQPWGRKYQGEIVAGAAALLSPIAVRAKQAFSADSGEVRQEFSGVFAPNWGSGAASSTYAGMLVANTAAHPVPMRTLAPAALDGLTTGIFDSKSSIY